jgi:hypothetical protein
MSPLHIDHLSQGRAARIAPRVRATTSFMLRTAVFGYLSHAIGTQMIVAEMAVIVAAIGTLGMGIEGATRWFDGSPPDTSFEDAIRDNPAWAVSYFGGVSLGLLLAIFSPDFILWDVIDMVKAGL